MKPSFYALLALVVSGCQPINLLPIEPSVDEPVQVDPDADGDGFLDSEETQAGSDPQDKFSWDFDGGEWPDFTDEAAAADYVGEGFELGDVMPDFTAVDQYGNEVPLSTFYGYVILLDFSAGWCGPCHDVAGVAQGMWETYRLDGFLIVHVIIEDYVRDGIVDPTFPEEWADLHELEFPVVLDESSQAFSGFVSSGLYDDSVPFTVLLDSDMRIHSAYYDSGVTYEAIPAIEELLGL